MHEGEHVRECAQQYESKMYLIKDKTFDELTTMRHKLEVELSVTLIEEKDQRIQKLKEDRNAVYTQI